MAFHGPSYGLSAELDAKRSATYDASLEAELRSWIESSTGERCGSTRFSDWLKSGAVLCKLVNSHVPGKCKFNATSTQPFRMMENIQSFLTAIAELGVPVASSFQTVDLFEAKNMNQVLLALNTLRRILSKSSPAAVPPPPVSRPAPTTTTTTTTTSTATGPKFCSSCGKGVAPGTKFCGSCGTKL